MTQFKDHDKKNLDDFLNDIDPWSDAYSEASFSFLGIKNDGIIELLQGQINLPNAPTLSEDKVV